MPKDTEIYKLLHKDIREVRQLCLDIKDQQGKFVTQKESNIKTVGLATLTLVVNGIIGWKETVLKFIHF